VSPSLPPSLLNSVSYRRRPAHAAERPTGAVRACQCRVVGARTSWYSNVLVLERLGTRTSWYSNVLVLERLGTVFWPGALVYCSPHCRHECVLMDRTACRVAAAGRLTPSDALLLFCIHYRPGFAIPLVSRHETRTSAARPPGIRACGWRRLGEGVDADAANKAVFRIRSSTHVDLSGLRFVDQSSDLDEPPRLSLEASQACSGSTGRADWTSWNGGVATFFLFVRCLRCMLATTFL